MQNREFFGLLGLLVYFISLALSIVIVAPKNASKLFNLKHFLPLLFLSLVALYVLPLSFFNYSFSTPSGIISDHFYSFAGYIPLALVLCSMFNLVFSFSYRKLVFRKVYVEQSSESKEFSKFEVFFIYILFSISIWLLYQLSKEIGGLPGLILSGYQVTELFINKGHYTVGFEWIVTLSLLLWGNALTTQRRKKIIPTMLLLLTVAASFAIMGRRGALVILIGSSVYLFHQLYKPIKTYKILAIGILGFYLLTLIGFLRGDSYENFSSLVDKMQIKKGSLDNDNSVSFFYTITTGNFAVPFETFPQVIKSLGNEYNPGFGVYSLRPVTSIIPSALWLERPLPLANWYMKTFYGTTPLNEGRQFFLLSAPFMDFGPSGIVIIGIIFAFFWRSILKIGTENKKDILAITFIAIIIASSLNIVSSDLAGWMIAFSKGYAFPIILIYSFKKINQLSLKYH
ncbi:MAG: O-antigen ligase [Bacteroidia bacterium]|nr:O-antigen ligase [Bacteroidia bacterium]